MKSLVISLLVIFIILHLSIKVCKIESLNVDASVILDLKRANVVVLVLLWTAVILGFIRGDFKFPESLRKRRT